MGKRGPRPLSSHVLALRGSTVPSRRDAAGIQDLALTPGLPEPPECIVENARALAEWRRIVPVIGADVLSPADRAALAGYCEAWATFEQAVGKINRLESLVVETARGVAPHPLLKIRDAADAQLRQWSARFGLSPVDRMGLGPVQPSAAASRILDFARKR